MSIIYFNECRLYNLFKILEKAKLISQKAVQWLLAG